MTEILVAWGLDLGRRDGWKGPDHERFTTGEADVFETWAAPAVDRLFVDVDARGYEYAELAESGLSGREYLEVFADITGRYISPVCALSYGVGLSSHAIVLTRSIVRIACDGGRIDERTIREVSGLEMGYLSRATESLGFEFTPSDIHLLVMSQGG